MDSAHRSDPLLAILRALGDEMRLRILRALFEKPRNVSELVNVLDVSQPDVSHHLRRLREAGLVEGKRTGRRICYEIVEDPSREARLMLNGLREALGFRAISCRVTTESESSVSRARVRKASRPRSGEMEDYLL
jgi:ArsR family transcriptional regulator